MHKKSMLLKTFSLLLLCMVMTVTLNPKKEIENRKLNLYVEKIIELKQNNPNTIVLLAPDWSFRTFALFYKMSIFKDYKNTIPLLQADNIYPLNTAKDIPKQKLESNPSIIFVDNWSSLTDPENSLYQFMEDQKKPKEVFDISGVKITYIR